MAVKEVLEKSGYHFIFVDLGEVEIKEKLNETQRIELKNNLQTYELVLMDDPNELLIKQIKNILLYRINQPAPMKKVNFSTILSRQLKHSYSFLGKLFSTVQGTTIEQYGILQKIERIKELLNNDKMSTAEIAWNMQYSSVAHLAGQFKKSTGVTPVQYKTMIK
jgi:AraC-like DNA-binding protein